MLYAYLDESGTHGASVCVLAGFMGSLRQWQRFEAAYRRTAKDDADEPGFHACEYFIRDPKGQRVKAYRGWDEARAVRLRTALMDAVAGADLWPLLAALDVAAFNSYTLAERQELTGRRPKTVGVRPVSGAPKTPYFLLFQSAGVQAVHRIKRRDLAVHFVFDAQEQFAPYALDLYRYIERAHLWEVPAEKLGSLQFASRKQTLPLQAADLLAYCWYQQHTQERKQRHPEVIAVLDAWGRKYKPAGLEGEFINKRTMNYLLDKAPLKPKVYLV